MKIKSIFILGIATLAMLSCHRGPKPPVSQQNLPISMSKPAKGDKAIYGLACMGCTDSVVIMLPNQGGDPVKYNILEANRNRQVFGNIEVGDWICIMKATWTYQVMPHLRDVTHLSKKQQQRILANMPDSIVETYMIPREYGFTLKRMGEARSVGMVATNSSVEDDSPVEYPKVPLYTEWHAYNGKLILVKGRYEFNNVVFNKKTTYDTLSFVYMKDDSLALRDSRGNIQSYHRKANARTANAAAQKAAQKAAEKIKEELK